MRRSLSQRKNSYWRKQTNVLKIENTLEMASQKSNRPFNTDDYSAFLASSWQCFCFVATTTFVSIVILRPIRCLLKNLWPGNWEFITKL